MNKTTYKDTISPFQVSYWKSQYEKQKLILDSIISLLNKYGNSLELNNLYKEFLLTLMGQFLASDSCYYIKKDDNGAYAPVLVYGKIDQKDLPLLKFDSSLVSHIESSYFPSLISDLPKNIIEEKEANLLSDHFTMLSPIGLKEKTLGIVFLGKKISTQPYTESEMLLLHSFCIVSAITFNHAILFQNTKLSIKELHKLNNIRTEVISRITHEFRTPLTVIKGGLSVLKLEEEKAKIVEIIIESIGRLENLISSLLDLNESWVNDSIASLTEWDPLGTLHESVSTYSRIAAKSNISFEIKEIPRETLPRLNIVPEQFQRIVNNLIDNAIKFSKESTSIFIEFEETPREPDEKKDGVRLQDWKEQFKKRISEYSEITDFDLTKVLDQESTESYEEKDKGQNEQPQQYMVFKITDGGIGIPYEDIPSLSEPFQQASNSPYLGVKGKGLGLTIIQKILSRCGGCIYCKSEEGVGTTFTVFLPLK